GEAREARNEVAAHVAHDHRDRIAVAGWHRIQAVVSDLAQRAVAELAIAGVFGAEVVDQHGFTIYLPILGSGTAMPARSAALRCLTPKSPCTSTQRTVVSCRSE